MGAAVGIIAGTVNASLTSGDIRLHAGFDSQFCPTSDGACRKGARKAPARGGLRGGVIGALAGASVGGVIGAKRRFEIWEGIPSDQYHAHIALSPAQGNGVGVQIRILL